MKYNQAPNVLPAIREWSGAEGRFVLDDSAVIVCRNGRAYDQIMIIKGYFSDLLGINPKLVYAPAKKTIIFALDDSACKGRDEGYELAAFEDSIVVTAKTPIGLLYGGITIVQSLYTDGFFPCGKAVDYPAYKVRGGMLDVARLYMPLEKIMEITKYMAWFKMNEVHVHINDNGKCDYSSFRLESDVPGLSSPDGYYTKEEYRNYQREAMKYGVGVITEIDSPHHARAFRTANINGWTPKFLTEADGVPETAAWRALDIRDEATIEFIENLFAEYVGGENPVFLNKVVHIGMDEYPKIFAAESEKYINRIIAHVNSLGAKARFWSSSGVEGFLHNAKISKDLNYDAIYWDKEHSGPDETVALDCDILNYLNGYLYIVPGDPDAPWQAFEDTLEEEAMNFLYDKWQVNKFSAFAEQPYLLPSDDPRMLGAAYSIWNDYGSAWIGLTYRDVIDRVRNITPLLAEKNWNGDDTGTKISFENYYSRFTMLCDRAGGVDLFYYDLPEDGINVDFSAESLPKYVKAEGKINENGEFVLDGESCIGFTYPAVGFPNRISFNIRLDEYPSAETALFAGYDIVGSDIFINPEGKLGLKAEINKHDAYKFLFDYTVPVNETVSITLESDMYNTVLIDGEGNVYDNVSDHYDMIPDWLKSKRYSTLTIPLSCVGKGIKGAIGNIIIDRG